MTNIVKTFARAAAKADGQTDDHFISDYLHITRAILQTLHDNITPEMIAAGVEEYAVQTYATASTEEEAVTAIIQRVIATALKGERA